MIVIFLIIFSDFISSLVTGSFEKSFLVLNSLLIFLYKAVNSFYVFLITIKYLFLHYIVILKSF